MCGLSELTQYRFTVCRGQKCKLNLQRSLQRSQHCLWAESVSSIIPYRLSMVTSFSINPILTLQETGRHPSSMSGPTGLPIN